ncbi:MAG: ABC transporter substrate-binding protein [Lentisphaerae bacterium]|nr:ABC transporter substrate-binding protein [Lentisphaerota bacterium]
MRKHVSLLMIAAAAMLILGGLSCSRPTVPAPKLPRVRLGIQDNAICALAFIAAREGLYEQEGVAVELKRYPSGKLAFEDMLQDKVDVATVADMPVTIHSFQRNDFALFGTIACTPNGAWIIARKDREIAVPGDLRGKTIGTQEKSAVHFFLSGFLLKNAIPEEEVKLVFMKAVDLPGALARGEIDAFSMRNPFIDEAKKLLGENAIEFFEPSIYRQTFNLAAKRTFLAQHRGQASAILRALLSAESLAASDKTRAVESAAEAMGTGRKAEVAADWSRYTYEVRLEQSVFITLENQARWAIRQGLAPTSEVPNFTEYINVHALAAVRPQSVSVLH